MSVLENFIYKIVGDPNEKELARIKKLVEQVNDLGLEMEKLSEDDFSTKTKVWQDLFSALSENPSSDERAKKETEIFAEILVPALALSREAGRRVLGFRAHDTQLIGAITLHEGRIAEMKTGEGKTFAGTMAAYLRALAGRGVHVVTVNDYLADRDAHGEGGLALRLLGMSVGLIKNQMPPSERRQQYLADVTYGTNNEFGFDYLRDNMTQRLEDCVQRGHYFAIVDEVDSILIDEARTPLIISAPAEEATSQYITFSKLVHGLQRDEHYEIHEKQKSVTLTEAGITELEKRLGVDNIYTDKGFDTVHHTEQALRAAVMFQKDRDYVVQNGEVIIVDDFTGRLMPGRRYSDGLHQAIEAKENVEIKRESRTLATITFQHYFRLYETLSGMTGTAKTEEEEFAKIYSLSVLVIPTNKPMIRRDMPDAIFRSEKGKFQAVVREIKKRHEQEQPVLVGTISIEKSEYLSELLKREGIKHEVLNAKNHAREAEIIANAGLQGAVTIATNMAGRGTDIKIGGPKRTELDLQKLGEVGGLHILGTERHESRRIDNQLRGRAGRQGEHGSSQFFVSLDDDLMRIFGGDRVQGLMTRMDFPEDQPLEHGILSKSIESAQKRVEGANFDMRKRLFEFDSVVNKHRERIYTMRRQILINHPEKELQVLISEEARGRVQGALTEGFDLQKLVTAFQNILPGVEKQLSKFTSTSKIEEIISEITQLVNESFEQKMEKAAPEDRRNILSYVLLRTIDRLWMAHIDTLSHLRDNVSLHAYGQRDPLLIYKKEAFELFERLLADIRTQVVGTLAQMEIRENQTATRDKKTVPQVKVNRAEVEEGADGDFTEVKREVLSQILPEDQVLKEKTEDLSKTSKDAYVIARVSADDYSTKHPEQVASSQYPKVGRNDSCPCGSGKKYKKCCLGK